jgi:hypothetical protein
LFGRKVDKRLPDLPVAALEVGASKSSALKLQVPSKILFNVIS